MTFHQSHDISLALISLLCFRSIPQLVPRLAAHFIRHNHDRKLLFVLLTLSFFLWTRYFCFRQASVCYTFRISPFAS